MLLKETEPTKAPCGRCGHNGPHNAYGLGWCGICFMCQEYVPPKEADRRWELAKKAGY